MAPPSKSYAHRLLIAAALSGGQVSGVAMSEDILATLDCLAALGFDSRRDGGAIAFSSRQARPAGRRIVLPCRESGSTMRFMIPLALALNEDGAEVLVTGKGRLMERGIAPYEKALAGVRFSHVDDGILISGRLEAGEYLLDASTSSQYLTGLMMALPLCDGDSRICLEGKAVSRGYLAITEDVLGLSGVRLTWTGRNEIKIPGGQRYGLPEPAAVEGDWSNAAYLEIFNYIEGNRIVVGGLNEASAQGDRNCRELMEQLAARGIADISENIDLGPVLFTLAALCGRGHISGTRRLSIKESDRVRDMLAELEAFGVTADVRENDVDIFAPSLHAPGRVLDGHNDHRIVMALVPLLTIFGGSIDGAEAVSKSFPDYFDVLTRLGIDYD